MMTKVNPFYEYHWGELLYVWSWNFHGSRWISRSWLLWSHRTSSFWAWTPTFGAWTFVMEVRAFHVGQDFTKFWLKRKTSFACSLFFYKNLILFSQKRVKAYKLRASGADRQYEAPFPGFTELLFPNSRSTLLCTRFYQWWRAILSPTKRTELFRKACQVSLAY